MRVWETENVNIKSAFVQLLHFSHASTYNELVADNKLRWSSMLGKAACSPWHNDHNRLLARWEISLYFIHQLSLAPSRVYFNGFHGQKPSVFPLFCCVEFCQSPNLFTSRSWMSTRKQPRQCCPSFNVPPFNHHSLWDHTFLGLRRRSFNNSERTLTSGFSRIHSVFLWKPTC